jgi:translation initiation factor eIF-2B subunit alpha
MPAISKAASKAAAAYTSFLAEDPVAGPSAAAIKALTESIKGSSATTIMGLSEVLREAGAALSSLRDAPMSIASLCELFVRFITRTALEARDFDDIRRLLIERGEMLARTTIEARSKIAKIGAPFVDAGGVVLTLGYSRCVVALLLAAAKTKHFSVIVAESHPQGDGHTTAQQLAQAGVPVTMVEDAAVAYVMSRCQMVLCGAEAVLESGGVIKTGTLSASDDLADRMPF